MRKGKRLLSWLLTAAMVITGVNLGTLTPVQAAAGDSEYDLVLERFESGANNDANQSGKLAFITTSENNDTGNMNKGAGVNGTTYGGGPSVCGNNRAAGIQFKLPENVKAEEIDSAILTINVANVEGCNLNSGWTKAALYETANPTSWSLTGSEGNSGNLKDIPSVNGYEQNATIWSKENIAGNSLGAKTFDVTGAIKNAVNTEGLTSIVLRLQTVRGGFKVSGLKTASDTEIPANAPTLKVITSKKSSATVKYLDQSGNELKEAKTIEMVKVASPYTYEIAEDEKQIETESGVYVYDESASTMTIAEVKENAADNVITLVYKKAEPQSVTAPDTIYAIEGNQPILPKQLIASTNVEDYTLPVNVEWEDISEKKWVIGDNTVQGTAKGLPAENAKVTATVHMYECDEAIDEVVTAAHTENGTDGLHKLSRQYKGKIISEFDITTTGDVTDGAFIYPDSVLDNNNNIWNNGGAMLHFKKSQGFFNVRAGDGSGGGAANDPSSNGKAVYDGVSKYHVRIEMDSSTSPGTYRAFVTDPNGNVNEVGTKANGFRKYNQGIIESYYVGRSNFTITNHKIHWQSGYATLQVEYKAADGTSMAEYSTSTKEVPGVSKTMDTALFTPKSIGGKTYLFDAENSGWDTDGNGTADTAATESADMPAAGETLKYIVQYREAAFIGQAETIETKTIIGKNPILPTTVKATYEGMSEAVATEVTWDLDKFDFNTETADGAPLEVTGTFTTGGQAKAKVHVKHAYLLAQYTFDGENPAADKTGNHADATFNNVEQDVAGVDEGSKGVKLKGGKNGSSNVKLPDDLLQLTGADGVSKVTQDDFTLSMFINRESNGNSFAMVLHATQVGIKDPQGHLGLINRDNLMDMEYRIGAKTVANLTAKDNNDKNIITPIGQWTHVAIVTNGSEDTAKLYLDGVLVGTVNGIVKPSQLVAQNNYLGRASWGDDDYKATFDDFEVYHGLLTEEEIQKIANDRLCNAPVQDVYDNLEISLQSGETLDKAQITEDLNLPTEMQTSDGKTVQGMKITWESSDPAIRADGSVVRPSKGKGPATVTLKAKIQYGSCTMTKTFSGLIVLEADGVSFIEFDEAYAEAKAKYNKAKAENIYTADSLAAMKAKLEAAEEVKKTQGTADEDADQVDAATAALRQASELLVIKSFKDMSEALAAWYPMDSSADKAKDASGNGMDGTAAESVTFSREDGATFNGGNALENCITLPNELPVSDHMTFAFWAKDARGAKSNAFGIGSGDGFGDSSKTDAHFFYVNTYDNNKLVASMNPKYWSGASNISVDAAEQDTWHHVVCVLSGTDLTLYVNGEKVGAKDVAHTVKEMWDADPNTRGAYIGNCSYGKNPSNKDKDYKGSIRDFRIYNAALAQEHVAEIFAYRSTLAMKYAKDDVIEALGARVEDDGSVILNITNLTAPEGKITLPETAYGDAKISWESSDNAVVNSADGTVSIPAQGDETVKEADLTARITIGEGDAQKTENIVFKCSVFYKLDIPTTDLENAISTLKDKHLKEGDYTSASWTALTEALHAAQAQVDRPTSVQAVADAKSALEDAESKLVSIVALRDKIKAITDEMDALEANDYTETSWKALQDKLEAATLVLETANATQAAITEAVGTLPENAAAALKLCGDKKVLEDAIADAQALEAYKEAYTDATWGDLETALQAAKAEHAKRLEDYAPAAAALQEKIGALIVKDEYKLTEAVKAELGKKLEEAKAENLASSNYTPLTWGKYKAALDAFEEVLGKNNATKAEAEDAAKALDAARAALTPVAAQIPSAEKKQELKTAYERATTAAAGMKPEAYTKGSWDRYQIALASMKKIADRLAEENNNVTKSEIDAAIAELNAATQGLVRNVNKDALNKAIKDYSALKSSVYTSSTWNAFQTALNAAKKVAAKADATQQEVNSALATLNAKKAALKKVVKVTKVTLSADSKNIAAGKKVTVKAKVSPSKPTNKALTWKTSNKKWATVSSKGVVTTKKAGAGKTVTITATAKDGSKKKGTIKIKIMKKGVTKVTLKAKSKKVKAGKKVTVKATVRPSSKKTTNTKLTWKTSNKKWATVNSKGVVTTKKAGKGKTVTVTATSTDGTKKSGKIKIKILK